MSAAPPSRQKEGRVTDDLLDEDEGDESSDDSGSDGDESSEDKGPKSSEKRVRDLQSLADKETARANKAEKERDRFKAALLDSGAEGSPPADAGGAQDSATLDMARMFVFQQHPKLAEYGLSEADLTGSTPGDIARSAADQVARLERVETKARNKLLAENGMAPEVDGGSPPPPARDFSKMSSEDFKKLMAEHGVK
jgi:hypothetical protein